MSMKIEVSQHGQILLREVFSGVVFEAAEGLQLSVCMRDDTFELSVANRADHSVAWYRFEPDTWTFEPRKPRPPDDSAELPVGSPEVWRCPEDDR